MTRHIIPARANVMGLDVADKLKGMMRKMSDRGITHARSGARIIPVIGDVLGLASLSALIYGAFMFGPAFADDRCAEVRAMPGAATFIGSASSGAADVIAIAPSGTALRWCYWNSPTSNGDKGTITVAGEDIGFRVEITMGPEIVHFDLPGAIATDLDGVPLREVSAPDGHASEGLLWRGMS